MFEAQTFWGIIEPKVKDLEIQMSKMKSHREILTAEIEGRDEHIRKERHENFEAIRRIIEAQLVPTQEANFTVIGNSINMSQKANANKEKEGFQSLSRAFNQRTV